MATKKQEIIDAYTELEDIYNNIETEILNLKESKYFFTENEPDEETFFNNSIWFPIKNA